MSLGPAGPEPFFGLVQLSVMRSMLGEITPEVRAISVQLTDRHVDVRVFHHGPASEDLAEAVDVADSEIRADFPSEGPAAITLDARLVRCDEPEGVRASGQLVFARRGSVRTSGR